MINTVADLLKKIIEKEQEQFEEFGFITHGPTIGDMFEGLTKDILEMALFEDLNIKVTSGFIVNGEEKVSNEIDCMIVEGEGKKIPRTDKYVYEYTQVIAVLEIKKTLYKDELLDSYKKMYNLYKMSEKEMHSMSAFRDAFRAIVSKELPSYEDAKNLPLNENMVYHSLLVQQTLPLRIVFGYDGYKTEFSFRNAFVTYLEENLGVKGYSPVSFPDLIVSGNNSLVKLNGTPYAVPLDENGYWGIYASTTINPIKILLEYIWTRLSYKYKLSSDIFGEDLEQEVLNPLLSTIISTNDNGQMGWEFNYRDISQKDLSSSPQTYEWSPREVTDDEVIIMHKLCDENPLSLKSEFFDGYDDENEVKLEDVVNSLIQKALINRLGDEIYLLTDECKILTFRGKWYADEDKSGRLMRWVMNQQLNK